MELSLPVIILLLSGLIVSAVLCVLLEDLLKAAIAMAVLSALLALVMFFFDAPLAAVLELSVCAGLITVVFISAISMTKVRTKEEATARIKDRHKRFALLPVFLIVLLCAMLFILWPRLNALFTDYEPAAEMAVESGLFESKRLADLLGQIVITLAGVFGVLIFFKEERE